MSNIPIGMIFYLKSISNSGLRINQESQLQPALVPYPAGTQCVCKSAHSSFPGSLELLAFVFKFISPSRSCV